MVFYRSSIVITTRYCILLLLSILFYSCSDSDDISFPQSDFQSGVVISFDDDYVDEWFEIDQVLRPYDWKATFFVSNFDALSTNRIQKLKDLKSADHEIGGHGLHHLNATSFISQNDESAYLSQEISPMLSLMLGHDLEPTAFAYPYGSRNEMSDNLLLYRFKILRGTTYGNANPPSQNCYYNSKRIVFGLGLDNNYNHFSIAYFLSILEYAKQNNKIVVFYAHKPVLHFENNYETEYQTLIEICKYVQEHDMKFYKMSELYNLENGV